MVWSWLKVVGVGGRGRISRRAMMPSFIIALLGIALAWSVPAEAHHQVKSTDKTSGVSIPSLTHGQLRIMSGYRTAILKLADRQVQPSLQARSLQNFINLQYAYCLWGMVPGSLSEENNPFNECSHAYLAATKELLARLQVTADTRDEANAISDRITMAMLQDPASSAMCAHSLEPFNTAQVIMPSLADVTFNPLGVVLGIFVFFASATGISVSLRGRRTAPSGG